MATTKESIYDQFSSSSVKKVKKISEEEDMRLAAGRSEFMKIAEGANKIRIMPKRKGEEHWMINVAKRWFDIESDDKKKEKKRTTVLDGVIHGGLSIDPIEAYIELCKGRLSDDDSEDRRKLKLVTASSYDGGMAISNGWMIYASHVKDGKITKIEKLELNKTMRDAINKEMFIEDEDDPIETDPYTHPLTGRAIIISCNSKAKKNSDKYSVKLTDRPLKLSPEDLQHYLKMTPLSEVLKYDMKQFEAALEGIQYIDETEDINLFEDEEFQGIIEKLREEVEAGGAVKEDTEDAEDVEEDKPVKKVVAKKAGKTSNKDNELPFDKDEEAEDAEEVEDEESVEEDAFTEMTRKELIAYKSEKEYPIKLLKTDSDDDMRNKLREHEATLVVEDDDDAEDVEDDVEEDELPVKKGSSKAATAGKPKLTIEDIKANLKGAKKK